MNKPVTTADLVTPKVTTGSLPASRKVYARPEAAPELRVPVREIILEASAKEPNLPVYDTTGVYSDPDVTIDVEKGLARTRIEWVKERGGVEQYDGRPIQPVDNGNVTGKHLARNFPNTPKPWRAIASYPSPFVGEGGAPQARLRASSTRYGAPGGGRSVRTQGPPPLTPPHKGEGKRDHTPSPNTNGPRPASSPRK